METLNPEVLQNRIAKLIFQSWRVQYKIKHPALAQMFLRNQKEWGNGSCNTRHAKTILSKLLKNLRPR